MVGVILEVIAGAFASDFGHGRVMQGSRGLC